MVKNKKIAFKTIGCRLNQFETDALVSRFYNAGYTVIEKDQVNEKADVVIINTCTVTRQSDKKSKYAINRAAADNPGAVIIAAGCLVNNQKEILEKKNNITYVIDNEKKSSILSLVEAHFKGELVSQDQLPENVFGYETVSKSFHTRTFIKIQDGCDNFCSYCIVPMVRGKAVSRKPSDIIDNVKRIVDNGFREIVLTGVNIGRYDHEGINIEDLIRMILAVEGDFRVRISSIEPDGFGMNFHELFQHPKLTPHLHLCLQSGSDAILKKMKRMYSVKNFMETLDTFRKSFPHFNFTTDIIAGFPGETDEDFNATCRIAEEALFSHIHTFRYSRRTGTQADKMDNQVPENIKQERSRIIQNISIQNRNKYLTSLKGTTQKVLVEKTGTDGIAIGYGEHFVPVMFYSREAVQNEFYRVKLTKATGDGKIWGEKL